MENHERSLDDLWNSVNCLYSELEKKGQLIINGIEPDVEVGYLSGSEYNTLSEGTNLRNAINTLYQELCKEVEEKINNIQAEADNKIRLLRENL